MLVVSFAPKGQGGLGHSFVALQSRFQKLRGLLGTPSDAMPVALIDCRSIHTFGMSYPIDVAFLDGWGGVVRSCRGLPPWRAMGSRRARMVLERPASDGPWFDVGDSLVMTEAPIPVRGDGREERGGL